MAKFVDEFEIAHDPHEKCPYGPTHTSCEEDSEERCGRCGALLLLRDTRLKSILREL